MREHPHLDGRGRCARAGASTVALSAAISLLVGVGSFAAIIRWSGSRSLVKNDGIAYFLYARSMVVDRDVDVTAEIEGVEVHLGDSSPHWIRSLAHESPTTGRLTLPWPVGSGAIMAPFYAVGWGVENVAARAVGRKADSYGLIPQIFFSLGSVVYGLVGFWATVCSCERLVDPRIAMVAALAMAFAGTLAFYVFINPTMAHAPSFGFVGALVLLWWRPWGEPASSGRVAVLGALLGILVTIRYQNVVFGILLLGVLAKEARRTGTRRAALLGLAAVAGMALPVSLETMSHVGRSGSKLVLDMPFFVGVEQNAIRIGSPHFWSVLFSCQHGAFYWTPVFALGFVGLAWAAVLKGWARIFLATVLAHVYLIGGLQGFEDQNWSGGHAFGMRYLTECSVLLAIGLAVLLRQLVGRVRVWLVVGALTALVVWNGGLMGAWAARQISTAGCVTYSEMATAVGRLLTRPFDSPHRE